jgi:hypothetical protein
MSDNAAVALAAAKLAAHRRYRPSADGAAGLGIRDSLGARLHLVGVGGFATLSLTFLVSHHDESFALA